MNDNILPQDSSRVLNWETFLWGVEESHFLLEVALRSLVMFIVVVGSLRLLGKRSMKQISVFELVIILTLGAAAGDFMYIKDVGLLPSITVFAVVLLLYRLAGWLVGKSEKFEALMAGKPVLLIENGKFSIENFAKEPLAYEEFFAQLRLRNVSHLGQVRLAWIETHGDISLFFYEDKDVRHGLPILPADFLQKLPAIEEPGHHACEFCGNTENITQAGKHVCKVCRRDVWVKAQNGRRIT